MNINNHEAELCSVVSVELSPVPREGYREVASLVIDYLEARERNSLLESELRREKQRSASSLELAEIDDLTQVRNDRSFKEYFPKVCEEMQRTGSPLALFFIDTDGQKRVNDDKERCGWEVGNSLIRLVANRALTILRAGDDIFRIGGDEFVVVAPDFTADHPEYDHENQFGRVQSITKRFESTINNAIKLADFIPDDLHVGVSVGGVMRYPNEDPDTFLKRAEMSMAVRKAQRREELAAYGVIFADSRLLAE